MQIASSGRAPVLAPRTAGAVAAVTLSTLLVTSCATVGTGPAAASSSEVATTTHGHVAGATELAEPRLGLVLAGRSGTLTLFDLLDGTGPVLPGATEVVESMAGDGRFVFPSRATGDRTTVEIVDSARWTVEHGDHFHYYRAGERVVGTITGTGPPAVHPGDRRVAITFPADGRVLVLAVDDLAAGTPGDPVVVNRNPHPGMFAVPFAGYLLVTTPDPAGMPAAVELLDGHGRPVEGSGTACPNASDAATTRVGAVIACADGAVLVTAGAGGPTAEKIGYPAGIAPAARSLDGRAGRPVLAGATDPSAGAGPTGFWQLDTRRREWTFRSTDVPLVAVSAVGDDAGLTVAVDSNGRIRVFGPDGADRGTSAPLLAGSTAGGADRDRLRLLVDANRAYVSGPAEGVVLEVDYRDGARIARTFDGLDPEFLERVG